MARNTLGTPPSRTPVNSFVDDGCRPRHRPRRRHPRGPRDHPPRGRCRPPGPVGQAEDTPGDRRAGLIVMVGDNDAGAFGTYTQAGQNYGTHLLWTLLLLVPVLYVNQEMVLRLGAVSGVGHARLILERFGKFWGAFSVIDLFILNALTIVTEFIGVTLAVGYLGLPKSPLWRSAGRSSSGLPAREVSAASRGSA